MSKEKKSFIWKTGMWFFVSYDIIDFEGVTGYCRLRCCSASPSLSHVES